MMKALVLHGPGEISIDDINIDEQLGDKDVRIEIKTVGICGSDIHYYKHGRIGSFIVEEPMVLGHEASGIVLETGSSVADLKPGDRVCMEPGIPNPVSRATILGMYNLDPEVRFWATPPVHGCLRETVVHPAMFTFRLPDAVGFEEGALIEPLAVGLHAVTKASIKPWDTAVVTGCGTIGLTTALAAMAAGCGQVLITDVIQEKLALARMLGLVPVDVTRQYLAETVLEATGGWGANVIFEASGSRQAIDDIFSALCPGGTVVFIGMPAEPVPVDIVAAQAREARIETVFRYAHQYSRALALVASGKINVKPLVTDRYSFSDSIKAFEYAVEPEPRTVKTIIEF